MKAYEHPDKFRHFAMMNLGNYWASILEDGHPERTKEVFQAMDKHEDANKYLMAAICRRQAKHELFVRLGWR
jgi:hypothetical protein